MNSQSLAERRLTDAVTERIPQDIDRFEDEGGPGPEDTRHHRPDDAPVVPIEVAQPELPLPIACPKCVGEEIPMHESTGAVDPNQVIITAGATAHSAQAHHSGIPELRSHGESPESAAANLAEDLAHEIDGAADDLHREPLERALVDVQASIDRNTRTAHPQDGMSERS